MDKSNTYMGNLYLDGKEKSREVFQDRAKRIASELVSKGLQPDEPVAILMRNDTVFLEVIEACRYVGAPYVTLNWHASTPELVHILEDSKAKVVIGHCSLTKQLSDFPNLDAIVYSVPDPSDDYEKTLETAGDNLLSLEEMIQKNAPIESEPKLFRGLFPYTSGSTGKPKGIRRVVDKNAPDPYLIYSKMSKDLMLQKARDRFYTSAPLYHSAPIGLTVFSVAGKHVDVFIASKFDAEGFLADIERYKITHCYIVPTMMVRLLKLPLEVRKKYDVSSLRYGISSGSPWPADVKTAMIDWFGPIFYESYGSSELGFMTLISTEEAIKKPGSVGKVLPGGSIKILDDNHSELPCGETGAIFVSLPMFGEFDYTNFEGNLSAQRNGAYTTVGDLGYVDEEGYVYINGRNKDMIISGGANVFPAEIEAELLKMPGVLDCAVFGAPDKEFGEMIVAAIEANEDSAITIDDVREFLEATIARFKLPKKLDIHESLPREDTGKIFKQKLREPYWEAESRKI